MLTSKVCPKKHLRHMRLLWGGNWLRYSQFEHFLAILRCDVHFGQINAGFWFKYYFICALDGSFALLICVRSALQRKNGIFTSNSSQKSQTGSDFFPRVLKNGVAGSLIFTLNHLGCSNHF